MSSALERLRKARQGSETSLASANITSGTTGTISSGSSALARLRAARSGMGLSTSPAKNNTVQTVNSGATGSSALARLRAARTSANQTSAAVNTAQTITTSQSNNKDEKKNRGGLLGGIGYVGEKITLGTVQGIEGIFDFLIGGAADIFGADDFAERQFANDWLNYSHADEWYNPGEGWKVAGDVGGGIGSSAPSIATAAAVTYFSGGAAAPIAAALVAGTSAAGTATKEAYQETGKLTGKEWGYGILSGATEGAIEGVSGALGAGAAAIGSRIGKAFGKTAAKEVGKTTLKTVAKDLGKDFLSEAFEEGFSEFISPQYKKLTYDPNAKNATAGEIGYAAFVGGLSGLFTSGAGATVSQVGNIRRGAKAEASGSVDRIKAISEVILEADGANTDEQSINAVRELYRDLTEGKLKITEGQSLTVKQKRALGELQQANMAALFQPKMAEAAGNAIRSAEAVAERLNSYGNIKIDKNGKLVVTGNDTSSTVDGLRSITAEDLRAGFDEKNGKNALRKAMQNNEVLRYVAASDVAGRLIMSVEQFEKTSLEGTTIKNQVDLNNFIEEAGPERRAALGRELGIADSEWDTLQLSRFNEAVRAYRESGRADAYKSKIAAVNKAKAIPETEAKKKIPNAVALGDGKVQRYKTDKVDIAIYREGDSYTVYDYNENAPSRMLSRAEVNSVLEQLKSADGAADVAKTLKTAENAELTNTDQGNVSVSGGNSLSPSARMAKDGIGENIEVIDLSGDTELATKTKGITGSAKYKIIQQYIFDTLGNQSITLSDGRIAVVDNRDAAHIAHKAGDEKIARIAKIKELVERAELYAEDDNPMHDGKPHNKFDYFGYYRVAVKYNNETFPIYVNVGRAINDGTYHIYDITKKIGDTAKRINVFERPKPNEGYAPKINVSDTIIPDSAEKSNSFEQNSQENAENSADFGKNAASAENSSEKTESKGESSSEKTEKDTPSTVKDGPPPSKMEAEKSSKEKIAEAKERVDQKKIDEYLRENVEDYAGLSAANQSMIRQVVREGRVHGLSEADILSYARVAARTGINIEYDANMKDGDAGYFDPDKNRIVVNPKAAKRQELILIHELDHALRAFRGNDGKVHYLVYKDADKKLSDETWGEIQKAYADQDIEVSREELLADEASAYYTEAILGGKGAVDMLLGKEPSLAKKILNFFTGAARAYSKDAKLSKEARRHYKRFKAMFDAFAEWNKGRNAETAVESVKSGDESARRSRDFAVFIDSVMQMKRKDIAAKRRFVMSEVSASHAKIIESIIEKELHRSIDLTGYKIVINGDAVLHITDRHGISGEADSSMTSVEDIANIGWAVNNAESGEIARKKNGNIDYSYVYKNSDNTAAPKILMKTALSDGETFVITECVPDSEKKEIHVISARKVKSDNGQVLNVESTDSPQPTSETPLDYDAASDNSISQNSDLSTDSAKKVSENSAESGKSIRKSKDISAEGGKSIRKSKDITPKVAEESGTQKPLLGVFDKHGRNIEAVRSMSETRFRADILKRFRYSNADNVRVRDFIDYHLGMNAKAVMDMKVITEAPDVSFAGGTLKDNAKQMKIAGSAMNIDIGSVSITPVRFKDFADRQLGERDAKLLYLAKSIIENGRVVAFSHPEGVFFEEIKIAARVRLDGKYTYAELTVHRNDESGAAFVYDIEASDGVKKRLVEASKPANHKRLYEKLGVGTAVTEIVGVNTEAGDVMLPPEIYTALRSSVRSVEIPIELYRKILVKSDATIANRLKATWGYNTNAETKRRIEAESKGKKFKERKKVSAKEFVKDISDMLQIPGIDVNDIAGSLVLIDRIYRVNRDGGKAYRLEIENERLKEQYDASFYKKLKSISYQVEQLKNISEGTFLNSTEYNVEDFKAALDPLHKIEYRGNLVSNKVRKSMQYFEKWYKADNPMLVPVDGTPESAYYQDYVRDMVLRLANGHGGLSVFELDQLDMILRHATKIVENFNRVWKGGKWVKADDTAKGFVEVADSARYLRSSADMRKISRLFDNVGKKYLTAFGDPMTLFRYMDGYQDGFFTWAGEELRAGAFRHGVDVMEMKADYDAFLEGKSHKGYVKRASKDAVEYGGVKMSKLQYISLYMTMQRQQAQRGLAENGFSLIDVTGQRVEVDGFLSRGQERLGRELGIKKSPDGAWKISDEQMKAAVESEISMMKKKLTDEDLEFIGIIERTLNGKCKELKSSRDMERLGYSNTISGYYYPIVRAMIAKTIDSQGMWGEIDRASNISANKDTVKGAAGALWIESADTVFNRHIDAVARYAELSPAIDAINKIFNLDISGNKNKPRSVRTATFNSWQTSKLFGGAPSDVQRHNGEAYLKDLLADLQGIGKSAGIGETFAEGLRGGFAISALAANPKVLMTQLSSVLASTNILSMKSVTTGMRLGFGKGVGEDVDGYCPAAKLRNYDSSAAKAQGVIENVRGVGEKLMTLVSAMDRGVVRMLWGACQVEIESTKGHKIGTEENKVEAGKLLERVLQETQQNSIATEKSAAMRSKSMLMKTLTMFTSDAMKSIGRVIDAFGHLASLNARIKAAETSGDAETAKALKDEREGVVKQAKKSVGALVLTAVYMTLIARAFSWLYAKDEEEERPVLAFVADVFGGMLGGLPIISDIYDFFVSGYDLSDNVYDTLNGVLEGVSKLWNTAGKVINGEATAADLNGAAIYFAQTVGTVLGLPIRNVRNMIMGLTRRFNPNAAYKMEMLTKSKNFASDFEEAVLAGDDDKAMMILGLLLEERLGTDGERTVGDADNPSVAGGDTSLYTREALRMSKSGYNILPRTIGSTVTIAGEEIDMTPEEQAALRARYSEAVGHVEALVGSAEYAALSDKQREDAVRFIYDAYYDAGIAELYGYERNLKRRLFSRVISVEKLALASVMTAGLESDYEDERGKAVSSEAWAKIRGTAARVNYSTVQGSKRKKVIAAINKLPLTTAEKLLIIAYKGYTIKDGDIRGVSAERAKQMLSRYARGQGLTKDEARALEEYL